MKKTGIYTVLCFVLFFNTIHASSIVVSSDIGFDANNSTAFLQQALNSNVDTLIIDNVGQPWKTAPLYVNQSNLTIIIEPNVEIVALDNVYDLFDSVFRIWDVENITILGYQATIRMNKQEYITANDSEYRHGFNIGSATNIRIEGLTIKDTGGDGMLISKSFYSGSAKNYCENIVIKNCRMDNNYRQGISVGSVKNGLIENCILSNTKGTLPEAGIDVEPDNPQERIEDLTIRNCQFLNNNGNGLQFTTNFLDDTSTNVSATIENCYFSSNHDPSNSYVYSEMAFYDSGGNGADGLVTIKDCYVENSDWSAIYISKTVQSYDLVFTDCVFKNVSEDPIIFNNPIFFEVTSYDTQVPRFGGVTFTDCTIDYDAAIPFLSIFENAATSDGLGNVTGNFFVVNPTDSGFETGTNPANVGITYQHYTTTPLSDISITTNQNEYMEGAATPIAYTISRASNFTIPLAVNTALSGEALYGTDYDLHQNFTILKAGESQTTTSFGIVDDTINENTESVLVTILNTPCYNVTANNSVSLSILDNEILSLEDFNAADFTIFPNPTSTEVFIQLEKENITTLAVFIHDMTGKKVFSSHENSRINAQNTIRIDISDLASGMYLISGENEKQQVFQKKLMVN